VLGCDQKGNSDLLGNTMKFENGKQLRVGLPSVRSRLHPKIMRALSLPPRTDSHQLVFPSSEVTVFFLRPWDIPSLVAMEWLDAAFCGSDVVFELEVKVEVCHSFEEYQAPISLCKRVDFDLDSVAPLVVATEYSRITKDYLQKRNGDFKIVRVHGACEAYPYLNGISAIADIVETGATLNANGLEVVDTVGFTSPCLIQGKGVDPGRRLGLAEWKDLLSHALA